MDPNRSGPDREHKDLLSSSEIKPRFLDRPVHSVVNISAEISEVTGNGKEKLICGKRGDYKLSVLIVSSIFVTK